MKYLCLIYADEQRLSQLDAEELRQLAAACHASTEEMKRSGHLVAAEALESVATATTLRVRAGRTLTTDGPYAETKEQLGGFYLIEARDLNEAIQLAARIPPARYGCVEVRPVLGKDFNNSVTSSSLT